MQNPLWLENAFPQRALAEKAARFAFKATDTGTVHLKQMMFKGFN